MSDAWRIGTAFERPRDPACRWRIPRAGYADGRLLIACYHAAPDRLDQQQAIWLRARLRDADGHLLAERLLIAPLPPTASDHRITDLNGRPVLPLGVVAIPVPASFDGAPASLTLALPATEPILLRLTDQRPLFGSDQHYHLRRRYTEIDE